MSLFLRLDQKYEFCRMTIKDFLQVATALDPCFEQKTDSSLSPEPEGAARAGDVSFMHYCFKLLKSEI